MSDFSSDFYSLDEFISNVKPAQMSSSALDWEIVRQNLMTGSRTVSDLTRRSTSGKAHARGSNGEPLAQRLRRDVRELEEAMSVIAQQLMRRREQLALLELYPVEDPCEIGDVLIFTRKFPNDDSTSYHYVARKTEAGWYVSGKVAPQGVTWEKLTSWLGVGTDPREIIVYPGSSTDENVQTRRLVSSED